MEKLILWTKSARKLNNGVLHVANAPNSFPKNAMWTCTQTHALLKTMDRLLDDMQGAYC